MHASIAQLLQHASEPIGPSLSDAPDEITGVPDSRALLQLLKVRNGFFAFAQALYVRPFSSATAPRGCVEWNAAQLWKQLYEIDLSGFYFFASDLFGVQFGLSGQGVARFDPESSQVDFVAQSLTGWTEWLMSDVRVNSGWPLLAEWTSLNGPLQPGFRLIAKKPFVLQGDYVVDNLVPREELKAVQLLAPIANGIRHLPDGTPVTLKVAGECP